MYKIKKFSGWVIKNSRPEEFLGDPRIFYTDDEAEKYSRSSAMRKVQASIAFRVIELLGLPPGSTLLDLGSGPGLTAEVYSSEGYKVTCLDVIPKMLAKAKEKGFECVEGDMKNLAKLFPKRKFDAVVSASALQWLKNLEDIKELALGINHVLAKNSPCVIQFYPKSEQELNLIINLFRKNGFSVSSVIDNPGNPRKRTIFLVMKKI